MIKTQLTVKHEGGIHARPSALIAKKLEQYESSVTFTHENNTVDARSIMSLLSLCAYHKSDITIVINGKDEKQVLDMLITIFDNEFIEGF